MRQTHKKFSDDQVRGLLSRYVQGEIEREYLAVPFFSWINSIPILTTPIRPNGSWTQPYGSWK